MEIRESYFIQIYRRNRNDPRILVGTVETNGAEGKQGFASFDELRNILVSPKSASRNKKKRRSNRRGEEPE